MITVIKISFIKTQSTKTRFEFAQQSRATYYSQSKELPVAGNLLKFVRGAETFVIGRVKLLSLSVFCN